MSAESAIHAREILLLEDYLIQIKAERDKARADLVAAKARIAELERC